MTASVLKQDPMTASVLKQDPMSASVLKQDPKISEIKKNAIYNDKTCTKHNDNLL